jgi:SAM-dependent methyltransferase
MTSSTGNQAANIASPSPPWLAELLGISFPTEGATIKLRGRDLTMVNGILRATENISPSQEQTRKMFGYKWTRRDTYEEEIARYMKFWLTEKFGDPARAPWFAEHGPNPILLDAGCGAAVSGIGLFEPVIKQIRYLGVDVSGAVEYARTRFVERGINAGFIQSDLNHIPLPENSVDLIFSEGVLHHTDSTQNALRAVTRHLKKGGRIIFYVYRKKGPVREFTDDYIREKLQPMTPEQAWAEMMPLTKLGKLLGELNIEIDIPERIELLDIPAGRIDLQRFFYWHVCKAFHRPEMNLEEMNHINFDWFAPKNAHRQTEQEVRSWCEELSLVIEREQIEEAGISIIARKK